MHIAVSACLIGIKVRYDGGDRQSLFITNELAKYATFIPFCPEALAFGTPRPSVRLVKKDGEILVITNDGDIDLTKELLDKSNSELNNISTTNLSGIIFKARSPSCGLGSTKVQIDNSAQDSEVDGLFAGLCREKFPLLPMQEEGKLEDDWLRENFIMQLFAYNSFEVLKNNNPTMKMLVDFHMKNKFLLQAKDEKLYRVLGNIVANHEKLLFHELFSNYEYNFKLAISKKSSIKRNRNVLEHMSGFFKNELSSVEKEILHKQIDEYAQKIVPIIVPLSTIKLYAKKYNTSYILGQVFLEPYPKELALRSSLLSSK
ncbi:MAG: DUF523 and DUF1722 domain-containing protein [Sulfurimonas sp.]|uniref:YbgA family protein n=1 Tax=Sulfurimonas sp. TaxID=2022749 RepID=UPI00261CAC53|nr:DUF523 and DUF1722 domain-containing protein [Sulfurimonas sp.]MDD3475682.1 DUF523 and DUF1722 domain-containing protein [Sulfurimonas sp.]